MNKLKNINILENLIILGRAGCGKSFLLKQIVVNLIQKDKKTLILEPVGNQEYKQITKQLKGSYNNIHEDIYNVSFDNKLTTINFSPEPTSLIILESIRQASKNGVDVVVMDEAYSFLDDFDYFCEELKKMNMQIILATQCLKYPNYATHLNELIKQVCVVGTLYGSTLKYIKDIYGKDLCDLKQNRGEFIILNNN